MLTKAQLGAALGTLVLGAWLVCRLHQGPEAASPSGKESSSWLSTVMTQMSAQHAQVVDALPQPDLSYEAYQAFYRESLTDGDAFWARAASEYLSWERPPTVVRAGDFAAGNVVWFPDGRLNACYNALDRHAARHPDKPAIIYEADEPGEGRTLTYAQLLAQVCQLANWLASRPYLHFGAVVTIYMPMVPEAAVAMLACARLGLVHNVVFAGFSAEALAGRIEDSGSRLLITADQGLRGGKLIPLKATADQALALLGDASPVSETLVFRRTGGQLAGWTPGRDIWWQDVVPQQRPYAPVSPLTQAETPLFLLYTSGSTGKPKGLMHTTGGYLLYAAMTTRLIFALRPDDIFGCMADVGWITGHSYIVYGPLVNGVTTVMFESTPLYPTASRYWEVVQRHRLTQLYTAPTVIRALKAKGTEPLAGYDLSSLRVLGSVGEPISPEAWAWYHKHVGGGRCTLVDTFWQTETGGVVITPLPGGMPTVPGSASLPFFGIEPALLAPDTGAPLPADASASGVLVFRRSWPGLARTIWGNHARYVAAYFTPYQGVFFTGDGAQRDEAGLYFLTGRVDDVINVSGHRLSTAEIEAALGKHPHTAEAAVLGEPDELTGQAICAFVALRPGALQAENMVAIRNELVAVVRAAIGPIATPKRIVLVSDLPKTRSGKIMRRILRKLVADPTRDEQELLVDLGDLSTLANPPIIQELLEQVRPKKTF